MRKSTRILAALLCALTLFSSLLPFSVGAQVPNEYMHDGIDYSGNGTVINGNIVPRKDLVVNGDYVEVPVYVGKYEPGFMNWWMWHAWSNWSPSNNRINPDFSIYNGTDEAIEYDVESRVEHQYRRIEKVDTPTTKYYSVYKGTKWYNKWIQFTVGQWGSYPSERSTYKIISRYTCTEMRKIDTMVYNYEWRTSSPFRWFWENRWEAFSSRVAYRYRQRTLNWNGEATTDIENIPLNYSLYDTNGNPIEYGAYWTYSSSLSGGSLPGQITLVTRYTLNSAGIQALFDTASPEDQSIVETVIDMIPDFISYDVEEVFEQIFKYIWNCYEGKKINKLTYIITCIRLLYSAEQARVDSEMFDYVVSLDALRGYAEENGLNLTVEIYHCDNLYNSYIDPVINVKYSTQERDYISMRYQDNENINSSYFEKDAFGTVSYITDPTMVRSSIESSVLIELTETGLYGLLFGID